MNPAELERTLGAPAPPYDPLAVAMLLIAIDTPELQELGIYRWTWPGHKRPARPVRYKRNGRIERVFDGGLRNA